MATEYNHTNRFIEECGTTRTVTIPLAQYDYFRDLESRVRALCALLDRDIGTHFDRFNIIDTLRGEREVGE